MLWVRLGSAELLNTSPPPTPCRWQDDWQLRVGAASRAAREAPLTVKDIEDAAGPARLAGPTKHLASTDPVSVAGRLTAKGRCREPSGTRSALDSEGHPG